VLKDITEEYSTPAVPFQHPHMMSPSQRKYSKERTLFSGPVPLISAVGERIALKLVKNYRTFRNVPLS
jgi:hypothetical protein